MTCRTLATLAAAPLAQAKRGPKGGDMWLSPQGQYVLRLRAELERLGYFDDLREDWAAVERALAEGCVCFETWISRVDYGTFHGEKYWYRIVPVRIGKNDNGLDMLEWGESAKRFPPRTVSTREWGGR